MHPLTESFAIELLVRKYQPAQFRQFGREYHATEYKGTGDGIGNKLYNNHKG
jgi:hypothetical protein